MKNRQSNDFDDRIISIVYEFLHFVLRLDRNQRKGEKEIIKLVKISFFHKFVM